jgi:hypothetical protein
MLGRGYREDAGTKRQISYKLNKARKDINKTFFALILAKAGNFLLNT